MAPEMMEASRHLFLQNSGKKAHFFWYGLSEIELTSAGFDWEKAPGQYTVAFKIDKSLLPGDEVISESVPEPDAIASFILLIATLLARRYLKA